MATFPGTRLRRLRRNGALRALVRETRLDLRDFVMPLFVAPAAQPNEALPGMSRLSVEGVVEEAVALAEAGVQALLLFGVPADKDEEGSGAWDDDGIVQRALRAVRERFDVPVAAYNVSGEYAMVKAAAAAGHLDEREAALESLTAIRRAGADVIVSYWTKELARWL